ncbi:MAG: aminoacyl-tRNA hydrolase [Verrucomicrobia bacterium]|nr:MAG: aminoacyl-tRNA hydrolase [Verrucomicrobiota bacterium]
MRLVAGLGNPGPDYAGTRHNIGFAVLDFFAQSARTVFERQAKWDAAIARTGAALLMKPLTFMNRSGSALAAVADFYRIGPAEILVVVDDFALPLGRLRIRESGGPGGHNGLESVIVSFGSEDIPRLRLGIGEAPERASVDYVLSPFFEEEKPKVNAMIERAAKAIKWAVDNGITSAMNNFNKAEES